MFFCSESEITQVILISHLTIITSQIKYEYSRMHIGVLLETAVHNKTNII